MRSHSILSAESALRFTMAMVSRSGSRPKIAVGPHSPRTSKTNFIKLPLLIIEFDLRLNRLLKEFKDWLALANRMSLPLRVAQGSPRVNAEGMVKGGHHIGWGQRL